MKRLLLTVLILFTLTIHAGSQNPNPQASFSSAVLSTQPSLYLNFNDISANFLDQISGLDFAGTIASSNVPIGAIPGTLSSNTNAGQVTIVNDPSPAGTVQTINLQYHTIAPMAGSTVTVVFASKSGSNFTIFNSFTLTLAATTSLQTFTTGTNFSATTIPANTYIGYWNPTSAGNPGGPAQGTGSYGQYYVSASTALPSGSTAYSGGGSGFTPAISVIVQTATPGTITVRQPGLDSTEINNTSVEFPWDGYSVAPNNTLGAIDWNALWTMMVHIDRLNWTRSGTLVLASKGDISTLSNSHWVLYLQMAGLYSQLCFAESGGTGNYLGGICTASTFDAMPNGFNYNIIVTNSGTGSTGFISGHPNALTMYINGLDATYIPQTNLVSDGTGFGNVNVVISGSGTSYANATQFTSTGGGTNCVVTGQMNASGGVPTTISYATSNANSGCTSAPTIVLISPTGTGAVLTATLSRDSMNSTTLPLLVPGDVSAGTYYGVAGTTSTQAPTYIDEAAIFPGALTSTQIQSVFYQTKFHQEMMKTLPTPVPVLVFDDDGGGDMDNFFALQMVVAIQQHGIMHLAGVVSEDESVTCEAMWRQMLDQAGLNNIPLSVPSAFFANSGTGFCTPANVAAYNASTPLSNAAWEPSTTMYRTIFAKYPTTPIDIVLGGPFTAMAEFMESPADSISPLTGLQLMAQNAANGGAIYAQGLGCTTSAYPATTPCSATITGDNSLADPGSGQYVVANNGATPIYWIGGIPQIAGPGVLSTRTSNDPMYLLANHEGSDTRQCYDCLGVEAAVSSYFTGGVEVGYSGGTGYAASTPFTFSGGGTNCQGTGIMTASSGVPNGIQFQWGASAASSYEGIGNGCTSAPTINLVGAIGTGVTLTAYPTSVCGTYTIGKTGSVWSGAVTSATCSNHYFLPFSEYANSSPTSGAPMSWFINSLVDPVPSGAPRVH